MGKNRKGKGKDMVLWGRFQAFIDTQVALDEVVKFERRYDNIRRLTVQHIVQSAWLAALAAHPAPDHSPPP